MGSGGELIQFSGLLDPAGAKLKKKVK